MNKIIVSILLLLFSYGVYAVGDKKTLFSEMTGIVNFEGKPAENVRLLRRIENKDYDETITDEKGAFHFPTAYKKSSLFGFLAVEFIARQDIIAYRDGKEYEMWDAVKRVPEENSEARGKPLVVTCELTSEMTLIHVNYGSIFSLCTWDVEPDEKIDMSSPFDTSLED
ncbi:MAG: carboxypeptidase regulatory-like domain-containing protein [Alteromonadales bacterium]|nr:carboxypeptidase regulatory-like domain-containing protein [Alteromonadales bacterium]